MGSYDHNKKENCIRERQVKPAIMIAHGSTAVQAARIIAMVAAEKKKKAEAYCIAAEWHDKQAAACSEIAKDEPRTGADIRAKAAVAAMHHGASAVGLRLAASGLLRIAGVD